MTMVACGSRADVPTAPGSPGDESVSGDVEFSQLADGVWLHTSYKSLPEYGLVPSTGLIVRTDDGLLLIDTAWDDRQTERILQWTTETLGAPVERLIVTHAHDDKMGGVAALGQKGIQSYALDRTNQAARTRGLVPTSQTLTLDHDAVLLAGGAVEVFYPGPGHTDDNIVVFVEPARVLYGGCLIRPGDSRNLGNTADADVSHWDTAVEALKQRYGTAEHVVPSHGPPGGPELLDHTIALVRAHRAKASPGEAS